MPHFVMALTNKLLAHNFPATLSGGEGAMARMMHLTPLWVNDAIKNNGKTSQLTQCSDHSALPAALPGGEIVYQ